LNNRICLIAGTFPPGICGVGDYSQKILDNSNSSFWCSYVANSWSLIYTFKIIYQIKQLRPKTIFLQYPSNGYGWSIVPFILCFYFSIFSRIRFISVLHEFSSISNKGKFFIINFLTFSNHIIFTTDFERLLLGRVRPFILSKSSVIPIFSNITQPDLVNDICQRKIDLIYFGHIRPNKGLEDFLFVSKILCKYNLNVVIAGQVPNGYESFYQSIKSNLEECNINCRINLTEIEVSSLLNDSKISFLPYPDGISERRGSFLAAILCGCIVVSYRGPFTSPSLSGSFIEANLDNAPAIILHLLQSSLDELKIVQESLRSNFYKGNFSSWKSIVNAYESLCSD